MENLLRKYSGANSNSLTGDAFCITICSLLLIIGQVLSLNSIQQLLWTIILVSLIVLVSFKELIITAKLKKTILELEMANIELEKTNNSISQELNKSIFELIALFEFTTALGRNDTATFQMAMETMVDTIKRITNYDGCALFICDDLHNQVTTAVSRGFANPIPKEIPIDQFMAKNSLLSGQALFVEDISAEPSISKLGVNDNFRSLIAVPLPIQNKVVGVLLITKEKVSGFSREDLRLLFVIANEAALVIQNQHLYEKVYHSSITDGLTGLYNHRHFQEKIRHCFEVFKEEGKPFSLVLLDIDYFKNINDQYGHLVGDQVLKQVGQILHQVLPQDLFIARYGGEEFAILMPNISSDLVSKYTEKIRFSIQNYDFKSETKEQFSITVSLGIANYPEDLNVHDSEVECRVEKIINLADENLYRAKNLGRNQIYSCCLKNV